jgi:hypothetical protein
MAHDRDLVCMEPARRLQLIESDLDGIDYVQVPWDDQARIAVYFVTGPPPVVATANVTITGGVRITGIEVVAVSQQTDGNGVDYLEVIVDRSGDFSPYVVHLDGLDAELDREFNHLVFGFKAGCPTDFDCLDEPIRPPDDLPTRHIDYMAKDYASFRQLLVDSIPATVPEWLERHEADVGIALLELLAYEGDYISYAQDAAANEMHLETARQRESVGRHVALVDYRMHQGVNAKAFVAVQVSAAGTIPARSLRCPERTIRFLTRIGEPVDPASVVPPGPVIESQHATRAIAATNVVFEPVETANLDPALNEIFIHTWGNEDCCLPVGSTTVDLVGDVPLEEGGLLLLEELRDVTTGSHQHANTEHRQVVRLVTVGTQEDELYTADASAPGGVAPRGAPDDALVVTTVTWDRNDALTFPLCISTVSEAGDQLDVVAVARGNIVLVDHGETVEERHVPDDRTIRYSDIGYRFRLNREPLTHGFGRDFVAAGPVADLYRIDPRDSDPHIVLVDGDGSGATWLSEPNLLASNAFSRSFVAEPDHDGRALIRFGDGTFGREPSFSERASEEEENRIRAIYRIGNGRQGNVGRESIVHVLRAEDPAPAFPVIESLTNPLPAWGGIDPEPIDLVKLTAPDAFRAETFRAVTEQDYVDAAELLPAVSHSQVDFRWYGSWHTASVTVDPRGTDLLDADTETAVRNHLTRYKLAGYDLETDPPKYVALTIGIIVCVKPDHFRSDIRQAVQQALSATTSPDLSLGFFHPDNWTFRQPLHVSELYAAVEAVEGVDSAEVIEFHRYGALPDGEIAAGKIVADRLEILRLNHDPNFPENGVLELIMHGGK